MITIVFININYKQLYYEDSTTNNILFFLYFLPNNLT